MPTRDFPCVMMIMLCLRCTLGGAEKRYARVFKMLIDQTNSQHRLVINHSMLNLLQQADILTGREPYLIVLQAPFRRLARSHRIPRLLKQCGTILDVLWVTWQCWRVIHRNNPDVVHPLLTGIYFTFPPLLLHPRIGHVMSAYSSQFVSERDRRFLGIPLGATVKRWAMQHSHAVDALSEGIRADLIGRGIAEGKIRTAPCSFTDTTRCRPATQRERWIVFLGRLIDIKAPLLLARAIPQVLIRNPDVHFYFLGRGYLKRELEALVDELDVANHVTIRFDPRPTRILNRSAIFVSLQVVENYPSQSLLEAMACGNAVVATDVGDTYRLVDDQNGIRIPPTHQSLANAILQLLHDPQLEQKQKASRKRVLSQHTPDRFFEHITHVYQQASRRHQT